MRTRFFTVFLSLLFTLASFAQKNIRTKEGNPILDREQLIFQCLQSLKKDRWDKTAMAICECQVSKLDQHFTRKQVKQYTLHGVTDLTGLIADDSLLQKEIQDCYVRSGQTVLLQAEGFENEFLAHCRKSVQSNSDKTLDPARVNNFCRCQLELIKTKRLSDKEMTTLSDPNSLLFFEMIYRCGDPFGSKEDIERNWTAAAATTVNGSEADTINVLNLNGMTYVKLKIGSLAKVWLFDTGASDLMINTDMEALLKKENILGEANYLGTGEYELANGAVDTCRRYRINGVQIGRFTVDNVIVSVSEKGKRIIVGKALLNKFRNWSLNNQQNKLVLVR